MTIPLVLAIGTCAQQSHQVSRAYMFQKLQSKTYLKKCLQLPFKTCKVFKCPEFVREAITKFCRCTLNLTIQYCCLKWPLHLFCHMGSHSLALKNVKIYDSALLCAERILLPRYFLRVQCIALQHVCVTL